MLTASRVLGTVRRLNRQELKSQHAQLDFAPLSFSAISGIIRRDLIERYAVLGAVAGDSSEDSLSEILDREVFHRAAIVYADRMKKQGHSIESLLATAGSSLDEVTLKIGGTE